MPVIRDFRAKSIWLSELVELGKSDTHGPPSFRLIFPNADVGCHCARRMVIFVQAS